MSGITTHTLDEITGNGLGRWYAPDERDYKYLLRSVTGTPALASLPKFKYWHSPFVLNQGQAPECTGYSTKTMLLNAPVMQRADKPTPRELYVYAQDHDEWAGNDYDGSSVRAAMKAALYYGVLKSYGWAFKIDDALRWLALRGPLVVGTNWYSNMSRPTVDKRGDAWITPDGEYQGGHAYGIVGVNFELRRVRMLNNWGRPYGEGGRAWLSFAGFDALLQAHGECACAVE